jgi:hypothetical protein
MAHRIKEPHTTDESEHEKDDFNLLNDTEAFSLRRISNLDDPSPEPGFVNASGNSRHNYTFEKADECDDNDLNNRLEDRS